MADLHGRLLGRRHGEDRSCGADLGALRAFGAAVAAFVGHFGLHQGREFFRGPQHAVGTDGHAELAAGAVVRHVAQARGAGRDDRRRTAGNFFLFDDGQPAVGELLLCTESRVCGEYARKRQKTAARKTGGVLLSSRLSLLFLPRLAGFRPQFVGDGVFVTGVDAVHADHAAAVIDPVVFDVDARRLAVACAAVAADALFGVDHGAQQREAREEAQHRTHGTDGVAPRAAVAPGQHGDEGESRGRYGEGRRTAHPDVGAIEGVAVDAFGEVGQQVVAPSPERSQQVLRDAAVGAVRGQQGDQ